MLRGIRFARDRCRVSAGDFWDVRARELRRSPDKSCRSENRCRGLVEISRKSYADHSAALSNPSHLGKSKPQKVSGGAFKRTHEFRADLIKHLASRFRCRISTRNI